VVCCESSRAVTHIEERRRRRRGVPAPRVPRSTARAARRSGSPQPDLLLQREQRCRDRRAEGSRGHARPVERREPAARLDDAAPRDHPTRLAGSLAAAVVAVVAVGAAAAVRAAVAAALRVERARERDDVALERGDVERRDGVEVREDELRVQEVLLQHLATIGRGFVGREREGERARGGDVWHATMVIPGGVFEKHRPINTPY
jgi:hypothetical protein